MSVVANVLESAPDVIVNTGVTGGGGETNTSNNSDTDTVPVSSNADVAIVKSVDADDDAARQERHLHAARDEQRAVHRQGRARWPTRCRPA